MSIPYKYVVLVVDDDSQYSDFYQFHRFYDIDDAMKVVNEFSELGYNTALYRLAQKFNFS